jgi:hypothetical protein
MQEGKVTVAVETVICCGSIRGKFRIDTVRPGSRGRFAGMSRKRVAQLIRCGSRDEGENGVGSTPKNRLLSRTHTLSWYSCEKNYGRAEFAGEESCGRGRKLGRAEPG